MSKQKLEKKFGQSVVFVASTLLENGATLKSASATSLLKEAIHVISCSYEDKTEWAKEVHIVSSGSSRTFLSYVVHKFLFELQVSKRRSKNPSLGESTLILRQEAQSKKVEARTFLLTSINY